MLWMCCKCSRFFQKMCVKTYNFELRCTNRIERFAEKNLKSKKKIQEWRGGNQNGQPKVAIDELKLLRLKDIGKAIEKLQEYLASGRRPFGGVYMKRNKKCKEEVISSALLTFLSAWKPLFMYISYVKFRLMYILYIKCISFLISLLARQS